MAQPWDPSVKSLLPFPDVLKMMNDQVEWTQQLGDALLAQQADVLNAVQVLRGRAQAAGTLQSGPLQTVTVNTNVNVPPPAAGALPPAVAPPQQVIVIEPTQPDTVYVPAYDPNIAYGSWPYPSSPPPYLIGGWAAIATPYRYGSTGIMAFTISYHGDVWQANLGPETARLAAGIAEFNPGEGWEKVAE